MKKIIVITMLVLALVLAGCHFPGFDTDEPADPDNAMATEIARILTGTPVEVDITPTPIEEEPEEVIPTETVEPTPEPTVLEPTEPDPVEPEEPTPTPTETPAPTPMPVLAETDPALVLGEPDWVDEMESGDNWFTGSDSFTSYQVEDGFFKLNSRTNLYGWRLADPVLENFYLEFTLETPNCAGDDSFGIFFRAPASADGRFGRQGYLFGISCEGRFFLHRWDGRIMHVLINRTASDAINPGTGEVNVLGIYAEDNDLMLYINGQMVDEISDSIYLNGKFGIFTFGSTNRNLSVWVDQVRYWVLTD